MTKCIAIANQKGGVGKTTTAVNLSGALAATGHSVLLIDFDPQGSATVGCGVDKNSLNHSITDCLLQQVPLADICITTDWKFDLLPANGSLTHAEVDLLSKPKRESWLKQLLAPVQHLYDYIIIDCAPSLNMLTLNALVASHSVLIPVQCEYYALEGLTSLWGNIEKIKQTANPKLSLEGILRTMFDGRTRLTHDISEQLLLHFKEKVFQTVIPRNIRLAEAPSHGLPILYYDKTSLGAKAYLALAIELHRKQTTTTPALTTA